MSAPSLNTLRQFFDEPQARRLRRLMTGKAKPREYGSVAGWVAQCYNPPSDAELIMAALNEELDGFGVEPIRGRYVDSYHQDIQAAYVNQGDTYALTILLDHETGNYRLTGWGDWAETHERTRELV